MARCARADRARNGGSRAFKSLHEAAPQGAGPGWRTAMMRRFFAIAFAALALGSGGMSAQAQDKSITVFAAASMRNALDEINAAFLKATGIGVVASYAASSALAKQIEQGAPADIFAAADRDW